MIVTRTNMTWQMVCHTQTNWANESLGNSVAEFECLRLLGGGGCETNNLIAKHAIVTQYNEKIDLKR